ncbi:hypothetical protein BGX38DRAFT_1147396 [Terfezia claveryi]|nr:hypothetical protein BGX38DRAFT_1147396 [Terfezia claveryi]
MLELNLCSWDKEVKFDYDIKALVVLMRKDTEGAVKNEDHLKLSGQHGSQLDSRTVARVEGLFKIWDKMQGTHEVAYVRLLRIKGSSRLHSEEGMIRMEKREDEGGMQVVGISDIEGMVHVIPLEIDRVWSQMYRI